MFKIWSRYTLFLAIPLILSIFTHLWFTVQFPPPAYDEGEYMRRALNLLIGVGPQGSVLYDHPYFGPLLLAGILRIIDYPYLLNPSADLSSIELLWHVPRTVMGLFGVIDTFLVYRLGERFYNRNVALIASILFAVMPITLFTRWILLDSLLLPFLLSSILLATYKTNRDGSVKDRNNGNIINTNKKKTVAIVLLSGVSLGLAIFTKIPVITMVPLAAYLVFTNNSPKGFKALGIWFIPVILIPLIWPAYAVSAGQFSYWLDGIYNQTNRERQHLFVSIIEIAVRDPVLLILGTAGIIFAGMKKDLIILLWTIPFVIFLFVIGYVNSWYLIPLLPVSCIAAARLIEGLSKSINNKSVQQILPFITISGIGIFGLITTSMSITMNASSGPFEATALVAEYLHNNNNNNITVISNPNYFWILRHIFNLDYNEKDYSEYPDDTPVKTENVILIADPVFTYYLSHGYDPIPELRERIQKMYDLYATKSAKVYNMEAQDGQISVYINE